MCECVRSGKAKIFLTWKKKKYCVRSKKRSQYILTYLYVTSEIDLNLEIRSKIRSACFLRRQPVTIIFHHYTFSDTQIFNFNPIHLSISFPRPYYWFLALRTNRVFADCLIALESRTSTRLKSYQFKASHTCRLLNTQMSKLSNARTLVLLKHIFYKLI